jgi:transcriptional regulator PpsR
LVSVTSDIALVLDDQGFIRSVALGGAEPVSATASEWLGRQLVDTVTSETRRKVEELLREASQFRAFRVRGTSTTHLPAGADIPVAYTAVSLGQSGPLLVAGRDLRAVSVMQQRLVDAQQSMERDYWRMRQAETRYRLLFQIATDAVLVIDAETFQVVDANRAAARMFGGTVQEMSGRQAVEGIAPASVPVLRGTARDRSCVRSSRRCCASTVRSGRVGTRAWASPLAQRRAEACCCFGQRRMACQPLPMPEDTMLPDLMRLTPDAIAFTDEQGLVAERKPGLCRTRQDERRCTGCIQWPLAGGLAGTGRQRLHESAWQCVPVRRKKAGCPALGRKGRCD